MLSKLFVVSESASVDASLGTVSAFHILEDISAATFPFVIPRISVIAIVVREDNDPENPDVRLRMTIGDDIQLLDNPFNIAFQHRRSARTIGTIHSFVVESPGTLRFSLASNGKEFASWSIEIAQIGNTTIESLPFAQPQYNDQVAAKN